MFASVVPAASVLGRTDDPRSCSMIAIVDNSINHHRREVNSSMALIVLLLYYGG